jgi:hypothetical protein
MSGVCLQSQPRRAGHQELNRLMAPPRQGLNGASLDQLLQGLRFRMTLPLAQPNSLAKRESRLREGKSGAESLSQGVLRVLAYGPLSKAEIAQVLGRSSVTGALNRAISQLLDREEIGYTLHETPNSRLQKYQCLGGLNQ